MRVAVASAAASVVLATSAPVPAHADLVLTPLGSTTPSSVTIANDQDQLIVADGVSGGTWAVWSPASGLVPLHTLDDDIPGIGTSITALNERGLAVGTGDGVPYVFSFATMARTRLDHVAEQTIPTAIADDGTIVGVEDHGDEHHAVAWQGPTGERRRLEDGGLRSTAAAVNEHGLVAGYVIAADGAHPVLWDLATGTMTDLAGATGVMHGAGSPTVNDAGQVLVPLGTTFDDGSASSDGTWVVYDARTGMVHQLGPPGTVLSPKLNQRGEVAFNDGLERIVVVDLASGARTVVAEPTVAVPAFNDHGQVLFTDPETSATLYDPQAGTIDLGSGRYPDGITTNVLNDTGLITGTFRSTNTPWMASVPLGPLPPSNLRATLSVDDVVDLAWSPPAPSGTRPLSGYQVQRDGVVQVELPAGTTSWSAPLGGDPTVATTYSVVALNVVGASAAASATVQRAVVAPEPAAAVVATPAFTG